MEIAESSQMNIHGNNYEVNINRIHNVQSGIDNGNGGKANHLRETFIYMLNYEPLNEFCWLSISTIHKCEKVPETDKYIALRVQYVVLVCIVLLLIHCNTTNTEK